MRTDLESDLRAHLEKKLVPRDWIHAALDSGRIQSAKQAWRTLEKWEARGEYDYGVSLDLGWLTPTG